MKKDTIDDMLSWMSDSLESRVKVRRVIEESVFQEHGETHETRKFADELFTDFNEKLSNYRNDRDIDSEEEKR